MAHRSRKGNWGYSLAAKVPVIELIRQRMPQTLWVVGLAYPAGGADGHPDRHDLGGQAVFDLRSGRNHFSFIGLSVPSFFTGLLLMLIFVSGWAGFRSIYSSTLK